MSVYATAVPDRMRERQQRRRIVTTVAILAAVALAFYVAAFMRMS